MGVLLCNIGGAWQFYLSFVLCVRTQLRLFTLQDVIHGPHRLTHGHAQALE